MNQIASLTKRERLFQDGWLIDLSRYSQTSVSCTFPVFGTLTKLDPKQSLQIDLDAIVHYVLLMSEVCFKTLDPQTREFRVILSRKTHTLQLVKTIEENGVQHLTITRDYLEIL